MSKPNPHVERLARAMASSLGVSVEKIQQVLADLEGSTLFAPFAPPEESLCGEEEDLVTGGGGDPDPGPLPSSGGLEQWKAHCRAVGRSRVKAYDEAFSLVQAQLTAWMRVYPEQYDLLARRAQEAGLEGAPLTEAQKTVLATFGGGFAGFLRELRRVTQDVVRR